MAHISCAPTWRFHTELCKFLRNISLSLVSCRFQCSRLHSCHLQSWTKVLGQIYICGAFSHVLNKFIYTCSAPPPPPSYNVGHVYTLFLQSFNTVLGDGGRKQRILKRIRVLFLKFRFKNTGINAITQVSQGILSTIVGVTFRFLSRLYFVFVNLQNYDQKL